MPYRKRRLRKPRIKIIIIAIVSVFLGLLPAAVIYLNHMANNVFFNVDRLQASIIDSAAPELKESIDSEGVASERKQQPIINNAQPKLEGKDNVLAQEKQPEQTEQAGDQNIESVDKDQMIAAAQEKVNKPLETLDILRVGKIALSRLSVQEMAFMYKLLNSNVGKDELIESREILLNKLTEQDLIVIRGLGEKYGKSLKILDPSVPIN